MTRIKQMIKLVFGLSLTFIAMLVAYMLSTMLIQQNTPMLTPEETSQASKGLFLVSLVTSQVLAYIILNSSWHGIKLTAAIAVIHFGAETLMAQLESIYYNTALQMSTVQLVSLITAGALRSLIFAALAVFILGKIKRPASNNVAGGFPSHYVSHRHFAAVAAFYVVVYFLFGYMVAWQWEETRLFYTGTAAIKPFFTHFWDLFVHEDPLALPFQLLRGVLWAILAVIIVKMVNVKRWQASMAVALTFMVLLAIPLGVFPNPYLPPVVARSHFYEIASSMLLFGAIAGWMLYPGKSVFPTQIKAYGQS